MTSAPQMLDHKDSMSKPLDLVPSPARGSIASEERTALAEEANRRLVDDTIEAIGFGKFQWQLTFSCAFGFLVDQMLLVSVSLVTPQAAMEFGPKYPTLLAAASYAGLLAGALTLGALADNIGRRLVWHLSIFGISIATMVAASSPNWAALNVFLAICGFFGGGNLAIDLTILAESIPQRWSFILSGMAAVWGLGNVTTGLIAWPLLTNFGCPNGSTPDSCTKSANMGWRYLYITLGGLCFIMSCVRAFVLRSRESPRWLVACGRIQDAVDVLNSISSCNKSTCIISADQFSEPVQKESGVLSTRENMQRARHLFSGPKQARLMVCLMVAWIFIGIAYPLYTIFLPYYLAAHGAQISDDNYTTYRDWTVSSTVGVFGPFLSMFLISTKWFKSRTTMFISAVACAAFAGAFTTVRSEAENLAFSSMTNFWLNSLYAVIYSYTPQALGVGHRGLGTGFLMALGRMSSLTSPFIATFADVTTPAPLWVSCGCFAGIGLVSLVLPIDTAYFHQE